MLSSSSSSWSPDDLQHPTAASDLQGPDGELVALKLHRLGSGPGRGRLAQRIDGVRASMAEVSELAEVLEDPGSRTPEKGPKIESNRKDTTRPNG